MASLKKQTSNLLVRRLEADDINALIDICRKAFPDGIRGQNPRFIARGWWRGALSSAASETWVCSVDGEVAGFVILVTDSVTYSCEKRERMSGIFVKACTAISCPRLLLRRFFKKMVTGGWSSKGRRTRAQNKPIQQECVWIEPIAVVPHMRGRGIATKMLEHCEKRALELKRSAIRVSTVPSNEPAIKLYEKCGFVHVNRTYVGCTYIKMLSHLE